MNIREKHFIKYKGFLKKKQHFQQKICMTLPVLSYLLRTRSNQSATSFFT